MFNTPHNPIHSWLKLLAFIAMVGVSSLHAADSEPTPVKLTPLETAYLQKLGPIKMCVDPDWAPFEVINPQGQHQGIAADLVQLVAQRVGVQIELLVTKDWEASLAASRSRRCQIMSFLNQTPAREKWLIFTSPIFFDPNVIITREEHGFVADARGLKGERVALPRGTMVEERVRRDFPYLNVLLTGSEPESMILVSERQADLTIRSMIVAADAIKKEGLFNLKIAGQIPDYTNVLRIGVLKDNTMLRDILDKGVKTITHEERDAISNRHVPINVHQGMDHQQIWKIMAGIGVVLLVAVLWNRKLSAMNKALERLSATDKLTGLFNRAKLDEAFETEIQRSLRFKQPFGIVMLDIDHFKAVNDTHGHQAGDQVLVEAARLLHANTRETDIVGRWGGEEFMVLCPQTDKDGVLLLAENLRLKFQGLHFPVVQHKTASFGVTTYVQGDTAADLIARVDAALYAAKRHGRNRVEHR